MSQVSKYPVSKQISERIFEILTKSFVKITNSEEADQFISDLLTPTEKVMLSKRLAIAYLLEKNYDYRTIQQIIKVSTGTIASVNIKKFHGSEGYKKLISKIMKEEQLTKLFDNAIIKLLSVPASLETKGKTWTFLKRKAEASQRKNKKSF